MNEVKILGENINIAERENFESGNVLLNFKTCEVSVLSFFLSLLNKDSCSYAPKIRVTDDQMGHDCNWSCKFVRLFKKQSSKDL